MSSVFHYILKSPIFLLLYTSPYVNPSLFKCIFCTESNILILLIPFYVTNNTEKQNPPKEMNQALVLHQPITVKADLGCYQKMLDSLHVLLHVSSYRNTNVEASSPATSLSRHIKILMELSNQKKVKP